MNIQDLIIYNKTIPKREATYVDFPSALSKELCEYLSQKEITKPYCHQAEMFEKAINRCQLWLNSITIRRHGRGRRGKKNYCWLQTV